MPITIQDRNRLEIRQDIGYNLGLVIVSTATGGGDATSLLDTYGLAKGGDDEYNGRQVQFNAGGTASGKSFVSDFAIATFDATLAPAVTGNVTAADPYEMWKEPFLIEDINALINQAIISVSNRCHIIKQTVNTYTEGSKYEYNVLSGFTGLYSVEYVDSVDKDLQLDDCDTAWAELTDGDVTLTADTTIKKEGTGSIKMVAAAGLGAGDIMATVAISETDLNDYDELEIWVYSTVALDAGDLQVLLDDTAQCASALESLDIPATTAETWTRHLISLANPSTDIDIISLGIKQVTDKGAFTLYVDDVRVVKSASRVYLHLSPEHWSIVKDTTDKLQLTTDGLSITGFPTLLRLIGYQQVSLLTDDTTDSTIDPDYIIAFVLGTILMGHSKSAQLDIQDRAKLGTYWLSRAERIKTQITTNMNAGTRWIT